MGGEAGVRREGKKVTIHGAGYIRIRAFLRKRFDELVAGEQADDLITVEDGKILLGGGEKRFGGLAECRAMVEGFEAFNHGFANLRARQEQGTAMSLVFFPCGKEEEAGGGEEEPLTLPEREGRESKSNALAAETREAGGAELGHTEAENRTEDAPTVEGKGGEEVEEGEEEIGLAKVRDVIEIGVGLVDQLEEGGQHEVGAGAGSGDEKVFAAAGLALEASNAAEKIHDDVEGANFEVVSHPGMGELVDENGCEDAGGEQKVCPGLGARGEHQQPDQNQESKVQTHFNAGDAKKGKSSAHLVLHLRVVQLADEGNIVGAVCRALVAIGLENLAMEHEEDARHLRDITIGGAEAMLAEEAGLKAAQPDFRAEQLRESSFFKAEGAVEAELGIPHAGNISKLVLLKNLFGRFFASHMNQDNLCASGLDIAAAGAQVCQCFAAEGAADVAQEDEQDGAELGVFENADAELGLGAHGPGLNFRGEDALLFFILFGGVPEDERKGNPPDEIVREDGPGEGGLEAALPEGFGHADGAEDFTHEADQDDGPMAEGIAGSDPVADAIDADDHADALPEFGIVGLGHAGEIEEESRGRYDEDSPNDVVKAGGGEDQFHPRRKCL